MSLLESTIAIYGPRLNLSKSDSTLHVVRAKLCSGSRVVGIRYPEQLISLVDKQLEHETKIRNMTSQTLASSSHVTKDVSVVSGVSFLEPVTPVMAKLQHRVLTEPPTLNTFFKTKHLRHSRHSDVTTNSEPESKITSSACSSSELREGTGLASGRLPESRKRRISGSRKPCNSNKKVCRQTSILLFAKTTQECPLVGGSPQSRDVGRIASCPICGEQFPATALNVNINEHIDQCLID